MLKDKQGNQTRICEVNFTFALRDGMWVKDEIGQVEWYANTYGARVYPKWEQWANVAYDNGWTGMWKKVKD